MRPGAPGEKDKDDNGLEKQKHAKHQAMDQSGAGGLPAGHVASGGSGGRYGNGNRFAGGEREYHFPQPVHRSERFPSPSAETSPAPVETATKTIASFEALTPELFAPQGTLETDLGLPVSLDVQFTGGAAGEVAVAWQCAAGYDPSAEAGT